MSLPKYPEYKDSGVSWLGEVPAHWEVLQIKRLSPVQRGASPRPIDDPKFFDDDGEYSWVRIADVSASDGFLNKTTQRMSLLGSSLSVKIEPGELFISIAGTVGKPCISNIKACIHDGFVYFPRLNLNPRFLFRVFEAGQCYAGLGKFGTQLNLNTDTIGSICVALPPNDEVRGICRFLDRETAKIDALIAEQEKLIALLAEKRQATISRAVTRGLDPNVPLKDSGVPWLGKVPAHWEVMPLKRLVSTPITDGPHETPKFVDEGIPFVSAEAVSGGKIDFNKVRGYILIEDHDKYSLKYKPQLHDIYMIKSGATTGVSAIVETDIDFNIWSPLAAIRCNQEVAIPHFVLFAIRSRNFQEGVALNWSFGTQQNIGMGVLGDLPIGLPSLQEQQEITQYLTKILPSIEKLEFEATEAIALLKERRAALISAAVTGKIDVRGLAA